MEKQIQKLLEKATILEEDLDTSEIKAIELQLEDFHKLRGKLIYYKKENCFYKLVGEKWFKFKQSPSSLKEEIDELYDTCQKSEELIENRLDVIEHQIRGIKASQEAFFEGLKKYVDLKLKPKKIIKK